MESKFKNIYLDYLRLNIETGLKPKIDEMLLILLLDNIYYFEPLKFSTKDFYRFYKSKIDEKINHIKIDFKITEKDIENYKIEKNISEKDDYYIYEEVLEIITTYLKENPNKTKEEIYSEYYYNTYGERLIIKEKPKRKFLSKLIKEN